MAKVFFGCSMRGGYAKVSREELVKLRDCIEDLGHKLVSKHQLEEGIFEVEKKLANKEIHDRDYDWLREADVGIFEISNPSLGTGGEISDIVHLGKPVLCLFRKDFNDSVSTYILGKSNSKFVTGHFECHAYETLAEAKAFIKDFVEKHV